MVGSLPRKAGRAGLCPYGKLAIRAVCGDDVLLDSDCGCLPDLTEGQDHANVEVGIVHYDHDLMGNLG